MKKEIAIIHYNTPELTLATIRSVKKHTPGCHFTIFDNSDKRPFISNDQDIVVIDNTKKQIIDFDKIINDHPNRLNSSKSNHGSEKHMLSVDYLLDIIPQGFLLLDSDVLIKKDISVFFNDKYIFIGSIRNKYIGRDGLIHSARLLPFCLWINTDKCKRNNIRFAREGGLWMLSFITKDKPLYDTGGSFLFDCISSKTPYKLIDINEYIIHFAQGSYGKNLNSALEWLDKNKQYYN